MPKAILLGLSLVTVIAVTDLAIAQGGGITETKSRIAKMYGSGRPALATRIAFSGLRARVVREQHARQLVCNGIMTSPKSGVGIAIKLVDRRRRALRAASVRSRRRSARYLKRLEEVVLPIQRETE
jgi:hypothetical protein